MLHIPRNVWNNVVYTASEREITTSISFNLTLENQTTFDTLVFPIIDVSTFTERYNESLISCPDVQTNGVITSDLTIASNEVLVFIGNVHIASGITVTNSGTLVMLDGIVSGTGTYTETTTGMAITSNMQDALTNHYVLLFSGLKIVLIDLLSGNYDYEITDSVTNAVLETGKLLIGTITTPTVTEFVGNFPDKEVFVAGRFKK